MSDLKSAANKVLANWASGDLAAAVRQLGDALGGWARAGESGDICPFCSGPLAFGSNAFSGDVIEQESYCADCNRRFSDLYVHATRRQLDEGGNEVDWGSVPKNQ